MMKIVMGSHPGSVACLSSSRCTISERGKEASWKEAKNGLRYSYAVPTTITPRATVLWENFPFLR